MPRGALSFLVRGAAMATTAVRRFRLVQWSPGGVTGYVPGDATHGGSQVFDSCGRIGEFLPDLDEGGVLLDTRVLYDEQPRVAFRAPYLGIDLPAGPSAAARRARRRRPWPPRSGVGTPR